MKSISIIIPNFNGEQILRENVPIIIKHAKKYNAQIIIVDDKSQDESVEMIKKIFPQVLLIEKQVNEGFSSTVNLGVKQACTDLVCLLNSDVQTTENFLDPILPYFDHNDTAAVGMLDHADDGNTHGRGEFFMHRGFLLHRKLAVNNTLSSGITGWVSCGSGVFSKQIWEKLGGLDELFNPFYYEDVDFGYRAWKSGYKLYFESKAQVKHAHKKGAIKSNFNEEIIKTISYRNQIYTSATVLTDAKYYGQFIQYLPINIAIAIKNKDRCFLRAVAATIKNIARIQKSRERKIKTFTQTDEKVLEKIREGVEKKV